MLRPEGIKLRGYQAEGADRIRGEFASGSRAVLYVLPTGGGKTFTFSYISLSAAAKGNAVLILVHRTELLEQSSLSLAALGVQHGIVAPKNKIKQVQAAHYRDLGKCFISSDPIVYVASVQTIARRLDRWGHLFRLVIVDEAHHATAGQWRATLEACHNARVLGVTATPCRTDGAGLGTAAGGVFDSMVQGPTISDLIEAGYLVKPVVYAPPQKFDLSGIRKTSTGDYNQKQLAERLDQPTITGDAVAHYKKYLAGAPSIAFCTSIAHAEHTAAAFQAAGYRAAAVSGKTPDDERRALIAGLGQGKIQVLTSCDIISEGTDIPAVTGALLLRPTDSEGLYIQQVGRVLRPADGKENAIILDHAGNCLRHGLPDEDREWTLDGVEKSSRGGYRQEKKINVKQCPQCYTAHEPAPRCPACNHLYKVEEREVKEIDGELQQISEHEAERMKRERRREIGAARTREDFEAIAAKRGYKAGWVNHMLSLRKKQGRAA